MSITSYLPAYVPDNLGERDLRNLLDDMLRAMVELAEGQKNAKTLIKSALDELDIQYYVDQAVDETSLAADLSDLNVALNAVANRMTMIEERVTTLRELHRGPQGAVGPPGPQGIAGPMGPPGDESAKFKAFIERMKDMEDRMDEIAQALDEIEGK